jgi:hypothetical protein
VNNASLIFAAWLTIGVSAAVLVGGTYARGGSERLGRNVRPIAGLLLAAIALVVLLMIALAIFR